MTSLAPELQAAIDEVQAIVSADGARLDLLDGPSGSVHFKLDLVDASCADCVLPPASLLDVVSTSIRRRTGDESISVVIDDPRD